jgi:hypothetical protein
LARREPTARGRNDSHQQQLQKKERNEAGTAEGMMMMMSLET